MREATQYKNLSKVCAAISNLEKMLLLFAIGSSRAEVAGNEKEDFGHQFLIDEVVIGGGPVLLD